MVGCVGQSLAKMEGKEINEATCGVLYEPDDCS